MPKMIAAAIVLYAVLAAAACTTARAAGADDARDYRCDSAGRYDAMSEGADCWTGAKRNARVWNVPAHCVAIRMAVMQFGQTEIIRRARAAGATDEQIDEGRRCLK